MPARQGEVEEPAGELEQRRLGGMGRWLGSRGAGGTSSCRTYNWLLAAGAKPRSRDTTYVQYSDSGSRPEV